MADVAWSYSKLKNFETCPNRYYWCDIQKKFKEDSAQLREGDVVHKAMERALKTGDPLPEGMQPYQHWVDGIRELPGKLSTELQFAVAPRFKPATWFGKDVWFRCIADAMVINDTEGRVWDWKTGKMKNVDVVQLMIVATAVFVNNPGVKKCVASFVWLKEDCESVEVYERQGLMDHWAELLPRVDRLQKAHAGEKVPKTDENFLPKPNFFCARYCPVTSCKYHGK